MIEYDDDELPPSKSQRKRDMLALQALGRQLLEADRKTLTECQLAPALEEALSEYHRLPNAHGARKRQMLYIGKLMRDIDVAHIRDVLDKAGQHAAHEQRHFHELERKRDALTAGDDQVMEQIIAETPNIDIQHFRQLVRQARKEQAAGRTPTAARKLFRYLRELSEQDS